MKKNQRVRLPLAIAVCAIATLIITECIGGTVGPVKPGEEPPPGDGVFREDFSGIDSWDESPYLVPGDVYLGDAEEDVKIGTFKGETALRLNAYSTDQTSSGNPYMEKAILFSTKEKTPANYKLEFKFMIGETGGYPEIVATLANSAPLAHSTNSVPTFTYRRMPDAQNGHFASVDRNYNANGSTARIDFGAHGNFPANTWHTIAVAVYDGVYSLYVDGECKGGSLQITPPPEPGYITFRVQAMELYFKYISVYDYDGNGEGGKDPTEPAEPSGGTVLFMEDFSGINSWDESTHLVPGDVHLGDVANDVTIGTFNGKTALRLNVYSTDQTSSGNPYVEKAISFSIKEKTPLNYKLEFRFMIGETGGWPQIVTALADPAHLAHSVENVPTFTYRRMPDAQNGHYASVDRNYHADGSTARIDFGAHSNFPANTWHTIAIMVNEGVYSLYVNDDYKGSLQIAPPPEPGYITFRVQAMDLYFDYIKVIKYAGGGSDPGSPGLASIKVLPQAPGNIYPNTETLSFALAYANSSNIEQTVSGSFVVRDSWGATVQSGTLTSFKVSAYMQKESSPIALNVNGNGIFNIQVSASIAGSSSSIPASTQFSRVFPVIQDRSGSPFGICLHFGFNQNYANEDIDPPLIALGGHGLARDEIFWQTVEPVAGGSLSVPARWDPIINKFIAQGIEPLIILDYGHPAYDGGGIPYSTEGLNAWVKYVDTVARHFEGRVKHYEVWNEPNPLYDGEYPVFNPTKQPASVYTEMLKRTYTTLKGIDSNITVLGGAVALWMWNWIEDMMTAGAYGYMDALSIHPYSYPATYEEANWLGEYPLASFQRLHGIINDPKYGTGKPTSIWVTEFGWTTSKGATFPGGQIAGVSEELSAANRVRSQTMMLSLGYVDGIIWYNFQNKGNDRDDIEENFGSVLNPNDPNLPWGAKASYVAQNAMSTLLHKASFKTSNVSGTQYKYLFRRADGQDVLVAWNTAGQSSVNIPVGGSSCMVYDLYGTGKQVSGGQVTVTLSQYPIYIVGTIPNL
jgi:hypothetical protein